MSEGGSDHDDVQGLMARLAAGDRRAFTPVYEALWPLCVARARRLTGDVAEAEDVAQRALLTLFSKAASFDAARSATGWALTLTAFEARTSAKRRERRRESAMDTGHAADDGGAADKRVIRADLVQRLANVTVKLSGQERATLAACLEDGEGPRDPAFRKRKQRLVERLRALFRSDG